MPVNIRRSVSSPRTVLAAAGTALAGTGLAGAFAFALRYRRRAGLPHPQPVETTPSDVGLPFAPVEIAADAGRTIPGWLVPAGADLLGREAPGIVVVHGWESNRGRVIAHAEYLRAAGFHVLLVDARGHGSTAPETKPLTVAEFAEDAAAAARWLAARPEVTHVGVLGHSFGGAGALVAAASEPAIEAVVTMSAPADPIRLTRQTFVLAGLRIPDPLAYPLAWLTARVLLAPRRRSLGDVNASAAAARYRGPLLLIHGADDHAVPVRHLDLLASAALRARTQGSAPVETLVLPEYGHRLLFESQACRRAVASFFAAALDGLPPEIAGDLAAAATVTRPRNQVEGFGALGGGPSAVIRPRRR